MPIEPGQKLPDVTVQVPTADGVQTVSTLELLGSGTAVLVGIPGAFTPTCSSVHLPGYAAGLPELTAKGVSTVACMSVNDAWVMQAWAREQGVEGQIVMIADGSAELTKALGVEKDLSVAGMGLRSSRFAAVIKDGVVTSLEVEQAPGVTVSSCESILTKIDV